MSASRASAVRTKKINQMDKRIPSNPKYKNVHAVVDTGASLSKYMTKIEDIRQNYRFRNDEQFKRMKLTTFTQLMVQVYHLMSEKSHDELCETPSDFRSEAEWAGGEGGVDDCGRTSPVPSLAVTEGDYGPGPEPDTARSTFLGVSRGVGEMDINCPAPAPQNAFVDDVCPYMLLDVRDDDCYERCHMITAQHYPKAMLSRSVNYETKDLLAYKNKPGRIIVVYDEDERLASDVATTLVQRGYDNLFMLSGGMKVASKVIPEGLITGPLPESLKGPKKTTQYACKKAFTEEDICCVEMYLDQLMADKSTGSRLSQASTASTRMSRNTSLTTRSSKSSCHPEHPPFK